MQLHSLPINESVRVEVISHDKSSGDEVLGATIIDLEDLEPNLVR